MVLTQAFNSALGIDWSIFAGIRKMGFVRFWSHGETPVGLRASLPALCGRVVETYWEGPNGRGATAQCAGITTFEMIQILLVITILEGES